MGFELKKDPSFLTELVECRVTDAKALIEPKPERPVAEFHIQEWTSNSPLDRNGLKPVPAL